VTVAIFEVIAEPRRRMILDRLLDGECAVGELVDGMAMSQPAISKHLKVLRDHGLVSVRIDGPRRIYGLEAEALRSVDEWLMPYRQRLARSLDALERHLDEMPD
jgi:DNA-binding transcriptional ArsR family regulator